MSAVTQEVDGPIRHLRGRAEIEGTSFQFRADEIDHNTDTGEMEARGNVYYKNYESSEEIWADRAEYNTEDEKGKFFNVRGLGRPVVEARPGLLTSTSPFYFQGEWAERIGGRYILHNGFVTNCKLPRPWWRLRGPKFDIAPGDRAIAHHSIFQVRKVPIFYTPFFYKSLEKMPRRSGFLMPNIGTSSRRGKMLGIGYFWAINRSYDTTYRVIDFTDRGFAHMVDFRGKPRQGTDFDAIFYGVQDRGRREENSDRRIKEGGASLYVLGQSDLGRGFTARGEAAYLTSLRFRQAFTESYNEAIFSVVQSVGVINRAWSSYTLNAVFSRLENFQRPELEFTNPDGSTRLVADSVVIRKLPEVEFTGRDRQIWGKIPVWFSFQSSAGLLHRAQPIFHGNELVDRFDTSPFMNRVNFAPRVSTAFRWKDIHLIPSFGIQQTLYGQGQQVTGDRYRVVGTNLMRSARDISVDLVLPSLQRIILNRPTMLGEKLKHVIEPRATYRYVTGIGESFNRFLRFDETDLLSNTNEVEISLTNRFFAKWGPQAFEMLSWQIWQKRYFDPYFGGALVEGRRNVVASTIELTPYSYLYGPRRVSPVVSVLRTAPIRNLRVEWRADYDTTRGGISNSTISGDYRWSRYFVSIGHNQVRTDPLLTPSANQISGAVGFGEPNRRGWNAGYQMVYDYRIREMPFFTTQVTYNTDCCGLSFQFRRFNFGPRHEDQFRVAFAVANIGTFGTLKKQERLF